MKKILVILVGGTICTALNEEGTLSVSNQAGTWLQSGFEASGSPYVGQVELEMTQNLCILSENMTLKNWNRMLRAYREAVRDQEYDGVIFAHGTDTLAYSAALFSIALSGTRIPVFFVSANERLSSPRSNGNANFRAAVECICQGIVPNIYAVYRNITDERTYLHLASRLEQCDNYSEDFFSVGMTDITDLNEDNRGEYFARLNTLYPPDQMGSMLDPMEDWELSAPVLALRPYVGIDYGAYDFSRFAAVLHGTFHSGTACAEMTRGSAEYGSGSILYMLDRCAALQPPVDCYLAPSKQSGEVYETVGIIGAHCPDGHQIRFSFGQTFEMTYAKLVLAYSLLDPEERIAFLEREWNFEKFAQ
ncbi:MAG: asparaginase [Oscillospiraceae bacterium]|nr:asparaginase [Oscillospiraceae bacterium]